jgi:hypothetical protein
MPQFASRQVNCEGMTGAAVPYMAALRPYVAEMYSRLVWSTHHCPDIQLRYLLLPRLVGISV